MEPLGGRHPVGEADKLELISSARQIVQVNGQFVFLDKGSLSKARGWLSAHGRGGEECVGTQRGHAGRAAGGGGRRRGTQRR